MPAEKYVEPLIVLPGRRACSRSAGRAQGRVGSGRGAQGRVRNGQAGHRASGANSSGGPEGGDKHNGQKAKQCAGRRDTQCVPLRLSENLRRRTDRRRRGAELFANEQVETLGGLSAGGQCGRRRRRCTRSRRRSGNCWGRQSRSSPCRGACACAGAAADAAARGVIRLEVGVWRRCSLDLRRRSTRRRPYRAMSGGACSLAFAGVQGSPGAIRGAMKLNCTPAGGLGGPPSFATKGKDQLD